MRDVLQTPFQGGASTRQQADGPDEGQGVSQVWAKASSPLRQDPHV